MTFERNEHCLKFNLASAIGHITVMFSFFRFIFFLKLVAKEPGFHKQLLQQI